MDFRIAVFAGDGIGPEVIEACLAVLERLEARVGTFRLMAERVPGGAAHYLATGTALPETSIRAAEAADAILFGAMGMPDVRQADGTEIAPLLTLRRVFDLYAGVRPVKSYPNAPGPLADPRAQRIDLVVLRESTEGLFASHGKGVVIDDQEARDTMVITRRTSERLFRFAFQLARKRRAKGLPGKVTCVDKSNVFRSLAFFRKVFDECAAQYPDVQAERAYVDATALNMVRRPWDLDVLVMENMFGDILSDLAGGIVGGMGMAPCAEVGDRHGLFQPAHGSAPDIAGKGIANPIATLLSAAMMLEWLGERSGAPACRDAAAVLEEAIERAFAVGHIRPVEFGGQQTTTQIAKAVIAEIDR